MLPESVDLPAMLRPMDAGRSMELFGQPMPR
jgi:hypothetical protein